jgi:hypothetical protein
MLTETQNIKITDYGIAQFGQLDDDVTMMG